MNSNHSKYLLRLVLAVGMIWPNLGVGQATYFQQDFTTGPFTSTSPNATQFNTLTANNNASFTTSGGNLSMTRGTAPAQVAFVRNTNFSPVPSTMYLEVDINVANVVVPINGAAIFNIGQSLTGVAAPANADVFARFSINMGVNNTFQIRNVPGVPGGSTANSTTFANTQTVKVIIAMNNRNTSITYFDPRDANAPQMVLQPGTYDIWVENEPLRLGRVKVAGSSANVTLSNFNFLFNTGEGTIVMDNLRIRDIAGVLPVNLTYFNVQAIKDRVELGWETAWERNSSEFIVQRSNDLKEFGDVGSVTAAGEADGRRQYTFTDTDPLPGANYYRLRMVDQDGTYEYSKIKDVVVRPDQPILTIRSNPSSGDRIRLRSWGVELSRLRLWNLLGQEISFRVQAGNGDQAELIPASVLSPGMYVLTYNQEGFKSQNRIMVY